MTEKDVFDFQLEYTFADNSIARLDRPPEVAKSLYTAEVTQKVAMFIPSVRVKEVQWTTEGGQQIKKVVITNA